MKKYADTPILLENQEFKAIIEIKGETSSVVFTSKYNPLFSSVRLVRGDFKTLFSDFSDDHINRLIHENSKLIIDIIGEEALDPSYAVKQYVRYKTELDLATDIFLTRFAQSGKEEKQLADLKIAKEVRTTGIKDILAFLKERVSTWESESGGSTSTSITSGIRAGANPYPYTGRVDF